MAVNSQIKLKKLIKNRREMSTTSSKNRIEVLELNKIIRKEKVKDGRKFNMDKIEEAVKKGASIKMVKQNLRSGRKEIYALKNNRGELIRNRNEIIKIVEKFYSELYKQTERDSNDFYTGKQDETEVPEITKEEIDFDLKKFRLNKAAGEDGIAFEHLKEVET